MGKKQIYCTLLTLGFFNGLHTETIDKFSKLKSDVNQLGNEISQLSNLKSDLEKRVKEIEVKRQEMLRKMGELDTTSSQLQNQQRGINEAIYEYKKIEHELHDEAKDARQQKIEARINDIKRAITQQQEKVNMLLKQSI